MADRFAGGLIEYINELQVLVDIIEHAENIIFAKDINGRYTIANKSSTRYFGKNKDQVIGHTDNEIFEPSEAEWNMQVDREIIETGKKKAFEKHVLRGQDDVYFYVVKDLVRDKLGRIVGISGVVVDITDYKKEQHEAFLEHERAKQLEATNRLRANFMANISHNLRTPLMGILGAAIMNVDVQNLPYDIKRDLELFRYSAELLLNIVDEMTAYGPLLEGEIKIVKRAFYLSTIVRFIDELFGYIGKEQGISFIADYNLEQHSVLVEGDLQRLIQVLNKMLMMTIRFTSINDWMRLRTLSEVKGDNVMVTFDVVSNAIIPKDVQGRMFEAINEESERDILEHASSLGMEAFIARKVIQAHGGTLEYLEDEEDGKPVGIFRAKLEMRKTEAREVIVGTAQNKKILVADDNRINQHVLLRMMNALGAREVIMTSDGQEAVDAFRKALDDKQAFELVFMDIQMPNMNGIQATREIRKIEKEFNVERDTPIFAVTAFVSEGDRLDSLRAGMTGFIGKPVTSNVLLDSILALNQRPELVNNEVPE